MISNGTSTLRLTAPSTKGACTEYKNLLPSGDSRASLSHLALNHTRRSAGVRRRWGQVRTGSGKLCGIQCDLNTNGPHCRDGAKQQPEITVVFNSVSHCSLKTELFSPQKQKSSVLEMRVYFGLILSPSAAQSWPPFLLGKVVGD